MATPAEALKLGVAKHQAGDYAAAETIYRQILQAQPDYPSALHLLGLLLSQTGRHTEGIPLIEQAVALDPTKAVYHGNLGWAYLIAGRIEEARAALDRAIERNLFYPDAYYNRGRAHHKLRHLDEAEFNLRACLKFQPNRAEALALLGHVLQETDRFAEAEQSYRLAIEIDPQNARLHYNLGSMLQHQRQFVEAIRNYDHALRLDPAFAPALTNRGVALLVLGDFAAGWAGYEHRSACPEFERPRFPDPPWDGSPLESRTLLVLCEQGLGDTLQFIRYVKRIEPRGAKVIVAAQTALVPLLQQSGYQNVVDREKPLPAFDVHVSLLSLPRVFRTEVDSVPCDIPYLSAAPERVSAWADRLAEYPSLKVGIAWRGDKGYRFDRSRSIPLVTFAPLADVPGVQLFSLQKGAGSDELATIADRFTVVDLGESLDKASGAFLDTAALMKNLDLVITCDTAIGHLAGALGVPVWIALPQPSDWRWMLDRADSPWYPTVRLFRQTRPGDWCEVFERMKVELIRAFPSSLPSSR